MAVLALMGVARVPLRAVLGPVLLPVARHPLLVVPATVVLVVVLDAVAH